MLDLRRNSRRPSTPFSSSRGKRIWLCDNELESGRSRDSRMRSLRKGGTIAIGKIGFSSAPPIKLGIVQFSTPGGNSTGPIALPPNVCRSCMGRKDSCRQFPSLFSYYKYANDLGQRIRNLWAPTKLVRPATRLHRFRDDSVACPLRSIQSSGKISAATRGYDKLSDRYRSLLIKVL